MFNIISITSASGSQTCTVFGGLPGKELIGTHGRLGPTDATYIVAFPGLGYIKLTDQGSKVSGAGSWSVKFSGSSTNWFYEGDGQAKVAVDEHGKYTVSGGANTITGDITPW